MSGFDRDSSHLLEGSKDVLGGLVKKSEKRTSDRPQTSLLGLDSLAKEKKRQQEEKGGREFKKPRLGAAGSLGDTDVRISYGRTGKERNYRHSAVDTPSHPGGVSEAALERIQSRLKRDQRHGVYAESRSKDKSRSNGRSGEARGMDRGYETGRSDDWEKEPYFIVRNSSCTNIPYCLE